VTQRATPRPLLPLAIMGLLVLLAAVGGDWGTAAGQTAGPPPAPRGAAESAAPGGPAVAPPPAPDYRLPEPETGPVRAATAAPSPSPRVAPTVLITGEPEEAQPDVPARPTTARFEAGAPAPPVVLLTPATQPATPRAGDAPGMMSLWYLVAIAIALMVMIGVVRRWWLRRRAA
jgi:hypothetical protein